MKKLSGYLMAVVLVIATLTFAGWVFNINALKRPFTGNEMMSPITAFSIIMACVSFFLQCKATPLKRNRIIGKILAAGVLSISGIKLLALAGIPFSLDLYFFYDPYLARAEQITMGDNVAIINSAFGFFITGIALILTGVKGKWPGRVITFLALLGFIVGAFCCIGFIYHIDEFYGILPYMSVAPSTGLCFLLFSLGMMFENNKAGYMAELSSPYVGGKIARALIPIGIGVPVIFGYIGLFLSWWFPFSAALGTALLSLSIVVVFLAVLWFLSRILNSIDQERLQAEVQLERQAQLFNIIPDAVIYGNKDLVITSVNPAAEQLFNTRPEEMGKLLVDDLFDIELSGITRGVLRKELWGEKGFWRGDAVLTIRGGKKMNAMVLLKATTNAEGKKAGWMGVYTDISFLRLNEELQVANNYLEQLAFISAHDIKSPIVTLQGLVDLMLTSQNMKAQDLHILNMQKNVINQMQSINQALNEILKLRKQLKIKDKSIVEKAETMALGVLMERVIAMFENDIQQAGATLQVDISQVADVQLQQTYFQSLFQNLLSNSIKYRDYNRAVVIRITGIKADNDTIRFVIEDNGLGFDLAHNRKRLFGMFKRFHNHVEGTGVGLHIVKSIVDAFGGTIEVESEPGKGTRFDIAFKAAMLG